MCDEHLFYAPELAVEKDDEWAAVDALIMVGIVARAWRVDAESLFAHTREQRVVTPRHVAMYALRHISKMSFPEVGKVFDRDHSTVIHGVNSIHRRMSRDRYFRLTVTGILRQISSTYTYDVGVEIQFIA